MAKDPKTTGEDIVALYGYIIGLKKDINTIKNNHLKHMHQDINKTSKKIATWLKKQLLTQGDLCRIYFGRSEINDRNVISRCVNGPTKPPRNVEQHLKYYLIAKEKTD